MENKIDVILMQIHKIQTSGTGAFTVPIELAENGIIDGKVILNHEVSLIKRKESLLSLSQRNLTLKLHEYQTRCTL